jgi:hypothetical protein
VNTAFLLMTAMCATGADAPIPMHGACPHCAPAYHGDQVIYDDTCCDTCGKPSLFDRLRACFRKDECCEAECDCVEETHPCDCPETCCDTCCDTCGKPSLFDRLRACFRRGDCCEAECDCIEETHPCDCPETCCDTCGKPSLFDRLRACFRKDECCEIECECPCDWGHAAPYAHGHAAPGGKHPTDLPDGKSTPEKIPAPKPKKNTKDNAGEKKPIGQGTVNREIPEVIPAPARFAEPF